MLESLIEIRPSWMTRAACAGVTPALWYPERNSGRPPKGVDPDNNHGREGKELCADCPVVVACLEHALRHREKHGIWGGASLRKRRVLHAAFLARSHDFDPSCTATACRWCALVREHLSVLSGAAEGPFDLNGPNATHGRRATYAKGCRCGPCSLAISTMGAALIDADVDIPSWWAERFGDRTDLGVVDIAKMYAEIELAAA